MVQPNVIRCIATFAAKGQINSPIKEIERRYATASFLIGVRGLKPHVYIRSLATRGKAPPLAFPNCIVTAEGAWVGTVSKLIGEVMGITSKYSYDYQLPAPPEVNAAIKDLSK